MSMRDSFRKTAANVTIDGAMATCAMGSVNAAISQGRMLVYNINWTIDSIKGVIDSISDKTAEKTLKKYHIDNEW